MTEIEGPIKIYEENEDELDLSHFDYEFVEEEIKIEEIVDDEVFVVDKLDDSAVKRI